MLSTCSTQEELAGTQRIKIKQTKTDKYCPEFVEKGYMLYLQSRYFLKDKDPNMPNYYGRRFKPYVREGYMSGGAGYVISQESLKV